MQRLKKVLRFANFSIDISVVAIIVAAVLLSIYALFDLNLIVTEGSPMQYAKYKPAEDQLGFEELIKINDEVIGWITVYGTKIDYPITQGEDNDKYLSLSAELKYSLLGSIYLDYRNSPDFSDFCSILYGHNMTPRAMFGNVKDYKDKAYFDAHRYGELFYENQYHGVKFFALFEEDGYKPIFSRLIIGSELEKEEYLKEMKEKALILYDDVEVSLDDNIVMLYTCSNALTNGRELLLGKITDELYENMYAEDEVVIGLFERMSRIPILLYPLICLIILLIIWYLLRMKEEGDRKVIENHDE